MKDFFKRSLLGVLMAIATYFVAEHALVGDLHQFAIPTIIMAPILFRYLLDLKFSDTYLNIIVYFALRFFLGGNSSLLGENGTSDLQGIAQLLDVIVAGGITFALQSITLFAADFFDREKVEVKKSKRELKEEMEKAKNETGIWMSTKFICMYAFAVMALIFLSQEVISPVVAMIVGNVSIGDISPSVLIFIVRMALVISLNIVFLQYILDKIFDEVLTIRKIQNFVLISVMICILYLIWFLVKYTAVQAPEVIYIQATFIITGLVFIMDRVREECDNITKMIPEEEKKIKKENEAIYNKIKGKKMVASYIMIYLVCLFSFSVFYFDTVKEFVNPFLNKVVENTILYETYEVLLDFAVIILFNYLFIKIVVNILMDRYKPGISDITYFKSTITIAITCIFIILVGLVFAKHLDFQVYLIELQEDAQPQEVIDTSTALFKLYDLFNLTTIFTLYISNIGYIFFRVRKENKRIAKEEMARKKKILAAKKKEEEKATPSKAKAKAKLDLTKKEKVAKK